MNEEEIIKRLTKPKKYTLIEILRKFKRDGIENYIITKPELLQGLLDLYNKEKERNKDLEQIEKEHKEENGRLREETDKKDKIIYNLAFALADYVMYYEYDKCRNPEMIKNKAKEQIEYFTNKVEEDIKE